jgi:hypothetical protein
MERALPDSRQKNCARGARMIPQIFVGDDSPWHHPDDVGTIFCVGDPGSDQYVSVYEEPNSPVWVEWRLLGMKGDLQWKSPNGESPYEAIFGSSELNAVHVIGFFLSWALLGDNLKCWQEIQKYSLKKDQRFI